MRKFHRVVLVVECDRCDKKIEIYEENDDKALRQLNCNSDWHTVPSEWYFGNDLDLDLCDECYNREIKTRR